MNKTSSAFGRLWHWTDQASKVYRSKGSGDATDLHVPLLDINPEGKLEREIKDIIEELDIMIHITKTQRGILTKFIGYATEKLAPLNRTSHEWFKQNAEERLMNVDERIEKLEELRTTADSTATGVSTRAKPHSDSPRGSYLIG